ncbi:RrF2 family transcriptional regulator [Lacipirellula limnantheis]|uniref:Iron-responsive transcriptional regulator n=1 Tax=Lacipirellula limnantheis TaxID=2528024 RepID=A0A517TYD1_9BACT|nr:Rrf2 family transcriptional regulator [Lacipirellula limnantheis]QDT73376.1 iron-responsive transcriptional regulator [Lacipirellula limnantheis]
MCRRIDVPEKYVMRILTKLARVGVVDSVRGVDGGYRLAKPLHQVSLLAIVEAVDELPMFNVEPLDGLSASGQQMIKAAIAGIGEDVRKRLGALTLDRLKGGKGRSGLA